MKASSESELRNFAENYKLYLRRDECGDPVINGSRGNLYEDGQTLCLMIISDEPQVRYWNIVREKCLRAGMTLRQNGDGEGSFSFDPENKEQARLAIRLTGVRPKKQISEDHKAKLLAGRQEWLNSQSEAILQGVS
ncbi:MAG TPA: hypothetical protein VKQ11_06610 [Candidatus Sulfotelmatobacter sp.]|nr:hypothetical protein [Candidatus Sulfotelmatobacter sp.]